jgi:hypothetical protein
MLRHALVLTLAVGGCNAYRPIAPLDDDERAELVALRPEHGRTILLVAGAGTEPESLDKFANSLRGLGWPVAGPDAVGPSLRVEVEGPAVSGQTVADAEGDIFFQIFTLGLWPQRTYRIEEWRFHLIGDDGRTEDVTSTTTRRTFHGWLAGPLSAWPTWRYVGAGHAPLESAEERAARCDRVVLDLGRALRAFDRRESTTSAER